MCYGIPFSAVDVMHFEAYEKHFNCHYELVYIYGNVCLIQVSFFYSLSRVGMDFWLDTFFNQSISFW